MAVPTGETYDFIVVGGGTAGNVVAGRLAESTKVSVLVIEAGIGNPEDIDAITTPARAFELRGSKHDWAYKTTMIARDDYERVEKPNTRGKVLGGSSCLHYYTWIPGSAATYNDWAEFGGDTWNWENVKDYLHKSVTYHDDKGEYPEYLKHIGKDGPLPVEHSCLLPELQKFRSAMQKGWTSKGQKLNDNIYDGEMHGLVNCMNSIYKGTRSSSWLFVKDKPNVTIMHSTHSKRLIIDQGEARGIEVISADGNVRQFFARKEVIVSSGVFESPKLLMLSGIGPEDQLAAHKIEPIVKSPHVGQNLLDHPIFPHVFRLKEDVGLDHHLLQPGLYKDAAVTAYRKNRLGPYSSGLLELVGLPRIDDYLMQSQEYREFKEKNNGVDPFGPGGQPHFEIDFVPMFADAFQWHIPPPSQGDYLTVIVDLLRPMSKGEIRLKSSDPLEQPYINTNYFANELDLIALRQGTRWIDDILLQGEGIKDIVGEDYPYPLPRQSDEAMNKQILERSQTGYHPCGTCRLGKTVEQGVVDSNLKVHGVNKLRVIDASIFPVIPDCRIQNAVYMTAEKGADMIKAEHRELFG